MKLFGNYESKFVGSQEMFHTLWSFTVIEKNYYTGP